MHNILCRPISDKFYHLILYIGLSSAVPEWSPIIFRNLIAIIMKLKMIMVAAVMMMMVLMLIIILMIVAMGVVFRLSQR